MAKCCANSQIRWNFSEAESITLPTSSLDGIIMVNAIHHFHNLDMAFAEAYRLLVYGPLVIFTFDPDTAKKLWVFDYWPELAKYEDEKYLRTSCLKEKLAGVFSAPVEEFIFEMPEDFEDMFTAAAWKRPRVLVDREKHKAMSFFATSNKRVVDHGIAL